MENLIHKNEGLNPSDLKRDILVSQKIMYHLKEFFYLTSKRKRTQKKYNKIGHCTRKKLR